MPAQLILIYVFIFGLIIGSFLNCLIWRLHSKIPLTPFVKGGNKRNRSYCPKCGKQISWYDNIPLLSFIMLRGKCRRCGKSISWQYPIVEFATGLLFVMAFVNNFSAQGGPAWGWQFLNITPDVMLLILRSWFMISVMIVIFIYDLRWYEILDKVTLPACLVVLILNLAIGFNLWNLLISGIIGGSFFLVQFLISNGKWIGGGDIRLGLLMGLSLGWPAVLMAIFIAYFIGSIVGIGLILAGKKQWGSEVPLGVFLAVGSVISLFWYEPILNWYLNIF
jgi:prepilin signal peptidase PulO-like enzyme (type II secretory pathway)